MPNEAISLVARALPSLAQEQAWTLEGTVEMSIKDLKRVNASRPKRVAMVLSNAAVSPVTNESVGFWWSELTHLWIAFRDAGYKVGIFLPDGGACNADQRSDPRNASGYSADDLVTTGFLTTPHLAALPRSAKLVSTIALDDFDAVAGRTVTGFANVEEDFANSAVWDMRCCRVASPSCRGGLRTS